MGIREMMSLYLVNMITVCVCVCVCVCAHHLPWYMYCRVNAPLGSRGAVGGWGGRWRGGAFLSTSRFFWR